MTVIFMTNASEPNKVGKQLSNVATFTGTLREAANVCDPTILVEGDVSQVINCNYMYVEEFRRYYFITGIAVTSNELFAVSGHVDVLETYQQQIRGLSGIIRRQENSYNLYLDDGIFKCYQNPHIVLKKFPNAFPTYSWVLVIAGNQNTTSS